MPVRFLVYPSRLPPLHPYIWTHLGKGHSISLTSHTHFSHFLLSMVSPPLIACVILETDDRILTGWGTLFFYLPPHSYNPLIFFSLIFLPQNCPLPLNLLLLILKRSADPFGHPYYLLRFISVLYIINPQTLS